MKFSNKIQIGLGILKGNLFGIKTPIAVYLAITDRCNLRCKYCNIPNKKSQKELTAGQIFSLIDQITEMGAKRLQLTGGEPMLRKDIGKIIDYASSKGIFVTLSSNGFQVSERIKELKSLDGLFLSLDGFKKSHDFHKGEGTFDNTIKALETAKQNGINVWVTAVISKKNYNEMPEFLSLMKEKGAKVNIHLLYSTQEKLDKHFHLPNLPGELAMPDKDIRETLHDLIALKKKGMPIASSFNYLQHLLNWQDYSRIYSKRNTGGMKCWAGKLHCYVDADGNVYSCGDAIGRVKTLNFLNGGFRNAFKLCSNPCESCIVACDVEQNLMFSLNTGTILNWLRQVR